MKFEIAASDIAEFFRNTLVFSGGMILFILGCFVYGFFLNSGEKTLSSVLLEKQIATPENISILVNRKENALYLYADTVFLKKYRASFGNITQSRLLATERNTPVGEYKVTVIQTNHMYHQFIGIDFPNLDDAATALRMGLLTQKEFNNFKFQAYYGEGIPQTAIFGGGMGIHGTGKLDFIIRNLPFAFNWTDGSVAVSNEAISELTSVVKQGAKVVIR